MARIFITVDTEWDRGKPSIETENLSRLPSFHALCQKYSIRPVYFCAYEALENQNFVHWIAPKLRAGEAEAGAHLHPWTTPPIFGENSGLAPYPSELPLDLFESQLKSLRIAMERRLGRGPVSYRAGRFGFDMSHIPILVRQGIRIDSSITPLMDWRKIKGLEQGGPDFSDIRSAKRTLLSMGDVSIDEFPLTILPARYSSIRQFLGGSAVKWLRIFADTKARDLEEIVLRGRKMGLSDFVFMMHSNELHPRCNPYFRTEKAVSSLLWTLEMFFSRLSALGLEACLFDEVRR